MLAKQLQTSDAKLKNCMLTIFSLQKISFSHF